MNHNEVGMDCGIESRSLFCFLLATAPTAMELNELGNLCTGRDDGNCG